MKTVSFNLRVFSSILGNPFSNYALCVHNPPTLGDQMCWDKLTFGPIFIACNDYIKLVTLHICWMSLLFVFCCVSDYFVPNIN